MEMRHIAAILILAGACFAADAKHDPTQIGERNVAHGINFYSIEKEIALGRQLAIEVAKQTRLVEDLTVSEYINRLGQSIARNSDVRFPVTFHLIDSEEINAFTLPGGYIFVSTGLLRLSDNEAELASAIAHELGHAAARHATRLASRNRLIDWGTLPFAVLGGGAGVAVKEALMVAAPVTMFHFSREFETEADLLGLEYLWKSGYDPNASVDLFERVEATEQRQPGKVARLFRTHPITPDRIRKTQEEIDKLLPSRGEYIINTSEYEAIRERLNETAPQRKPESEDPHRPTLRRTQFVPDE